MIDPTEPVLDVFFDERVLDHDTGHGLFEMDTDLPLAVLDQHAETRERVANMRSLLARGPISEYLRWHAPQRLATIDELASVHDRAYIDSVRDFSEAGGGWITPSTVMSAQSWEPTLAAAGASLAAADAVIAGTSQRAFALVRPPGHHAQPAQADGNCLFNNAALVVERARAAGFERVAVLDWDVHHANGTQACFYDRADVLTISLHMRHGSWDLNTHPQSGSPDEIGEGAGRGYNANLELPLGMGDSAHIAMLEQVAVPMIDRFAPELLVVAAGQDASEIDPNGRQAVKLDGFRAFGGIARDLADRHCDGRMVITQEGGYARAFAALCLHATLEGIGRTSKLLDDPVSFLPERTDGTDAAIAAVREALAGTPLDPAQRDTA